MAKQTVDTIVPAGEILAATLVEDGLAVVLGWTDRVLPENGKLLLGDAEGSARTLSWPRGAEDGSHWFLSVMATADAFRLSGAGACVTSPNGRLRFTLPTVGRLSLTPGDLLNRLAPLAEGGKVVGFLQTALEVEQHPSRSPLMFAALERFAQADGFVEILGRADEAHALIQGWSVRLGPGSAELVLELDHSRIAQAAIATYERPDLGATARGVLAVLPAAGLDLRKLRRIYFRRDEAWHRLEIFENRRFLSDAETTPYLKGLHSCLRMDPGTAPLFKRLCGSRFEGAETVSTLARPVRAALDLAVGVPGTGMFLTGWVLDPERLVSQISLRNASGLRLRLDEHWVRSNRPDVSQGYGADPLFAGRIRPGEDGHGFVVGVPCQPQDQTGWYLELALEGGDDYAFLPIPVNSPDPAVIRRMLTSVNIHDPACEQVIAQQLAPLVSASAGLGGPKRKPQLACGFGPGLKRPKVSAIVPLLRPTPDFDVNLARFSVDPDMAAVELVVVTRPQFAATLGASLQKQARFYGRSGKLLVAPDELDICEALELGAEAAGADMLLFLSASVFPTAPGWVPRLAVAAAQSGGAVCPTLVYEDNSIKFAGAGLAGYSRHWLKGADKGPVAAAVGTVECCMIPRPALARVGGFARDYVGAELKGPDFFLSLQAAGIPCHWLPAVEMIALDEPAEAQAPEYWMQTGKLVDEWGFARKWAKQAA